MRILLIFAAVGFSAIFGNGEAPAMKVKLGISVNKMSKRVLFKNLPKNAASALLINGVLGEAEGIWLTWKKLDADEGGWWNSTPVKRSGKVATPDEIGNLISTVLADPPDDKKFLSDKLHFYVAVHHNPTLLSVYEVVTENWPYKLTHVTHIDLTEGKEFFHLPSTFALEGALEGADAFPQALEKLFSFHGTDLETFSKQLHAAKNKHSGLYSGLITELTGLQQLESAYLNSVAGAGEEAVHVLPSPYVSDVDEIAHTLGNSQSERNKKRNLLRLLASTEIIINDIDVLLQEFDAEIAMPQELEHLMQEINATKAVPKATPVSKAATVTEETPVSETTAAAKPKKTIHMSETTTAAKPKKTTHMSETTAAAKPKKTTHMSETTTAAKPKPKKTTQQVRLPEVARPYGEFITQARLRTKTKSGDKLTLVSLTEELKGNGFTTSKKTIAKHENFWGIPSRVYLQEMIDASYAELIGVDRETLGKIWELSQQALDREKIVRKFGNLLKKKREATGHTLKTLASSLIQDSRGELPQERFKSLQVMLHIYERNRNLPTKATIEKLLHAGLADKIGVSVTELETTWQKARQARTEAKKIAKTARNLASEEAVTQELPITLEQPVASVEADPVPARTVTGETTLDEQTIDIELWLANLYTMREQSSSPLMRELLDKEIERLEEQWLIEEEQRQARAEKKARAALEKTKADFAQRIAAVREQYSEQLGNRLDDIYREVIRDL